jgi:multiple sugar transport system permease protein
MARDAAASKTECQRGRDGTGEGNGVARATAPATRPSGRLERRRAIEGYLLISPWLIGFAIFTIGPLLASFFYSFTDYDVLQPPRWIGLGNYVDLFHGDPLFWTSLRNTLIYTCLAVPLGVVFGLIVALLLNQRIPGIAVLRSVYYLPSVMPAVAISILWLWLLDPHTGIINILLRLIGGPQPGWLSDPSWSKPALVLMSLWGFGTSMVIYLAGLQNIPVELYEAAVLDGANERQKLRHVTLPLLSPVILFNVIIGTINSFQVFTAAYIMTNGGPVNSTLFYVLYLFNQAFSYFHMGVASAMAWLLFLMVAFVAFIQFRVIGRRVYYEGASHR